MAVARNPEVLESKTDTAALKRFKCSLCEMQDKLLKEYFTLKQSPIVHDIVNKMHRLIIKKLVNEDKTYESYESLDEAFKYLTDELSAQCKEKKISTNEISLCEGFQLILNWYHMLAREAFLYYPLELEVLIPIDPLDQRQILSAKAKALHQKVDEFNAMLATIEKKYTLQKPDIDYKKEDLHEMFLPLFKLEEEVGKNADLFQTLGKLQTERYQLEKDIKQYNYQVNNAIIQFKQTAEENRKARLVNYDSLCIDVFNINEFRMQNKEKLEEYSKITDKRRYKKVLAIKGMTEKISKPLHEFEEQLSKYSSWLYKSELGTHYLLVKQIIDFLVRCCDSFKYYSYVLRVNREYEEQFDVLQKMVPMAKKVIQDELTIRAKKFLEDPSIIKRIRTLKQQSDENFEREIKIYINHVQPYDELAHLKPISLVERRCEQLNAIWQEVFFNILNTELQYLKKEFERVRYIESAAATKRVIQLRHHVWRKLDQLTVFVIIDKSLKDRNTTIQALLYQVCDQIARDKIYREMDCYLKSHCGEKVPVIPAPLPLNDILTHQGEKEIQVDERVAQSKSKPWYTSLFDQTWKRIVWGCLLGAVIIVSVLSVWGLIAGISLIPVVSVLGGGLITGVGCYLINKVCCQYDISSTPLREHTLENNHDSMNLDVGQISQSPANNSYRNILSSPIGAELKQVNPVKHKPVFHGSHTLTVTPQSMSVLKNSVIQSTFR